MATPDEIAAEDAADSRLLDRIEKSIVRAARGLKKLEDRFPLVIRQGLDEVIDPARSKRFLVEELESTEKTYIGTKLEILLRNFLGFPRGHRLDFLIDGIEVDVKNTVGNAWMIPPEAIDAPCILIRSDEKDARCWLGLVMARKRHVSKAGNRDAKHSISKGNERIRWILNEVPYPKNFCQGVPIEVRGSIVNEAAASKRVAALFRQFQSTVIDKSVIVGIGGRQDPMKRARKNGGAPDILGREGIAVLCGTYDSKLIAELGLPSCGRGEFLSFKPRTADQVIMLREAGKLP